MLRRARKLASRMGREREAFARWELDPAHLVWALGSLCAINRVPFDAELLFRQFPPPYTTDTLIHAARALGFRVKLVHRGADRLADIVTPALALCASPKDGADIGGENTAEDTAESEDGTHLPKASLSLLTDVAAERVICFDAGTNTPLELPAPAFAERYLGVVLLVARKRPALTDPDGADGRAAFGFRWFLPELLKHQHVWRDVLTASLRIQLLALGTPLFTQTIIDKVVVHHTESTLIVIAIGLAVFMVFSALLTWVRQYLVLHTGNRVDAVLAAAVFDHLFRLPPRYFERRPTGVIAARLQETHRGQVLHSSTHAVIFPGYGTTSKA